MPERIVAAQPGLVPAARRAAGTMFAALYGELVPHTWRDPESEHDAYSLFYHRSIAMGWLDDRAAGGGSEDRMLRAPGLWGMNDAGWNHPLAASGAELISWFQVGASAVADDPTATGAAVPAVRAGRDSAGRRAGPVRSTGPPAGSGSRSVVAPAVRARAGDADGPPVR